MTIEPFSIHVAQAVLDDLQMRLRATRLPDAVFDAGWDYGSDLEYLRELLAYFRNAFDWRAQERRLNELPHYRASVDGVGLHFVHVRAERDNALPLLLSHGFPDSFLRMEKLIPRLTRPSQYGGCADEAFDVVVPSLPGFGFSDRPRERGMTPTKIAQLFHELMSEQLGYARYAAHGGDWGSVITEQLAREFPTSLVGIHLTDVPFVHLLEAPPAELTEAERNFLRAGKSWQAREGAYNALQATKPQTLAYGLNDSPAGLVAWLVEKFRSWSDCKGDVETRFSKDELLTNVMLYWATQTIGSACRLYYESAHQHRPTYAAALRVPTGIALFPKDLLLAPREYAERWFNVRRWSELPRGGHFAAFEEPDLLAHELRTFFHGLEAS